MTILVTGASGFIGRGLVRHFHAAGRPVRAALRNAQQGTTSGVDAVVIGDIGPATEWRAALDGVSAIVHLAAPAEQGALSEADLHRVTVEGAATLARAAQQAGIRHFLLFSSAKVMGEESPPGQPFRDEDVPRPESPYARAKLAAEAAVLAEFPDAVILRPPLVYGPGVGGNFAKLLRLADIPLPLPLAGIDNRRAMLYLGNLVSAVETCLEAPEGKGRHFLIRDGEEMSVSALIRQLRQARGRSGFLLPGGPGLINLLMGRDAARRLCGDYSLDGGNFIATFDWQPPFDVQRAFRLTASGQQL
ncbi:MAG: NAD-dependent epimerase/dehydratase family protein [Alphaproteobacteria bacterium]|nr:NAD-dependent epimerase/dehydratase family protein [Alphaproteobacteria bacterium]MBU0796786.1 NAD-dependent epimerase/dehydratase family protein [Alphaproteobacteria bacterium]MBU0888688.1 NAD-dependent epimerase/dehydratase family protein [Alphaproteobacteria bacterium]MBU1813578.1 NAD-dependent epimerase/dehydratase family protein [Alphaproteobacteria bacterium]